MDQEDIPNQLAWLVNVSLLTTWDTDKDM